MGVSLGEHGMVTAQVIEGIQSTITEAINSPANGWVGHRWYVEIVRIIPEARRGISGTSTEELDGAAADETACRLLEGTEGQRHSLSEETLVQDDTDMERLLSRLLPLLACGSAHRGSTPMPGYQAHADPRVPQAFPPLALPEGDGGDKARGVAGTEKKTQDQAFVQAKIGARCGPGRLRPRRLHRQQSGPRAARLAPLQHLFAQVLRVCEPTGP